MGSGCRVDSVGSQYGPVVGCCEHGDEPSGSGATELVKTFVIIHFALVNSVKYYTYLQAAANRGNVFAFIVGNEPGSAHNDVSSFVYVSYLTFGRKRQ
jgi:hypothetical protein